jgi:hypothetical protein
MIVSNRSGPGSFLKTLRLISESIHPSVRPATVTQQHRLSPYRHAMAYCIVSSIVRLERSILPIAPEVLQYIDA